MSVSNSAEMIIFPVYKANPLVLWAQKFVISAGTTALIDVERMAAIPDTVVDCNHNRLVLVLHVTQRNLSLSNVRV